MEDFANPETETKDRNFVTALARGLEILRCFGENERSLTNSEIAERTGLPKATVSRLTHTLCVLEYLAADPRDGSYRLSAGVLHLGFSVLAAMDIGERAKQEMRSLRDGPNSYITVALAEQHHLDAVYLATSNSREGVTLAIRVGSRLPIFHSAIGRAILVGMSEEQREAVFEIARAESVEVEADGTGTIGRGAGGIRGQGVLQRLWHLAQRCERYCGAGAFAGRRAGLWAERGRAVVSGEEKAA